MFVRVCVFGEGVGVVWFLRGELFDDSWGVVLLFLFRIITQFTVSTILVPLQRGKS